IGAVVNLSGCEPASDAPEDVAAARRADGHTNRWWLDPLFGRGYPADMVAEYGIDPPVQAGDLEIIAAPMGHIGLNFYFRQLHRAHRGWLAHRWGGRDAVRPGCPGDPARTGSPSAPRPRHGCGSSAVPALHHSPVPGRRRPPRPVPAQGALRGQGTRTIDSDRR